MRFSITKRLALIAMIPATLLAMVAIASPASAAGSTPAQLQGDVVYLTNKQRALHGCKPVRVDARLNSASLVQSSYMARTGKFSHTGLRGSDFVYRVKAAHYPRPAGENIAYGYRSGLDVVKAWMASPGHRANILNCGSTAIGVAAVYAANGTTYFTQEFGY